VRVHDREDGREPLATLHMEFLPVCDTEPLLAALAARGGA
jgi:hypothetical protein